ncbi:hypothetical protein BDN67DRAFT_972971 [Paxillus ammoniavirescens]|nr:hypothetical protein BDN67DRAFT_972971 [Paxillus ammoniavirescens]
MMAMRVTDLVLWMEWTYWLCVVGVATCVRCPNNHHLDGCRRGLWGLGAETICAGFANFIDTCKLVLAPNWALWEVGGTLGRT